MSLFTCVCSLSLHIFFNSNFHVKHYRQSFCMWMVLLCSKRGTFKFQFYFFRFFITCIFHQLHFSDFSFSGTCVFLCKCVLCVYVFSNVGGLQLLHLFHLYFLAMAFYLLRQQLHLFVFALFCYSFASVCILYFISSS